MVNHDSLQTVMNNSPVKRSIADDSSIVIEKDEGEKRIEEVLIEVERFVVNVFQWTCLIILVFTAIIYQLFL
ncbi:hypothetical protein GCK72_009691 [Caenorhabditis remanei]|uniref:Uncharacterized protein n=1 Tax=Caenorhabditis remanei TaxID=31234 RepID=A0A6A5H384_CAERE|nr:hypothetical protein GCK72_009691 [Caenorhabditis remanei]KAF1761435.1 hypothetical protein GCK72_009691 [Caenorhabditis remanei]